MIELYCDGSCNNVTGEGGWAILSLCTTKSKGTKQTLISGYEQNTTSNRMEMRAFIEGIKLEADRSPIKVYTDATYISTTINEGRVYKWQANKWRGNKNSPILNVDLWEEIIVLVETYKPIVQRVKAHSPLKHIKIGSNKWYNRVVDKEASLARVLQKGKHEISYT